MIRRPRNDATGESGAVGAGLAARQPAVQRGDRPDGQEGPLERDCTRPTTGQFAQYVEHPELAGLLPVLYPGVFPNLAGLTAERADLVAILLTGIPSGIIPGFQNFTGTTHADMLRLNMAIPPASQAEPLGLLGGDLAGFPNGRRVSDDVVTIELRAIAGRRIRWSTRRSRPTRRPSAVTREPDAGSRPLPGELPVPRHPARRLRHSLVVAVT